MSFPLLRVWGALAVVAAITTNPVFAVDVWYDFEVDTGTIAADQLTGDGNHDGDLLGNYYFQPSSWGPVPQGDQALYLDVPSIQEPPYNSFEIGGSTALGASYTLAMHANNLEESLDFTRLFSSYGGTGPVLAERILFDYDPTGTVIPGIRAIVNNVSVGTSSVPTGMTDPGYHHYAVTVDNGDVVVYFDGTAVASGNVGTGYSNAVNLRVGEDPHDLGGGALEQLYGNVDDILVIDEVLSAGQIGSLAGGSTVSSIVSPTGSYAVNYDFEGDTGTSITDKFTGDGQQNGVAVQGFSVDTNAANAKLGSASGALEQYIAPHKFSQIDTGVTGADLGDSFTLSAAVNVTGDGYAAGGLTRLFSTYGGSGATDGRIIMDFEPDASSWGYGLRLILPDGTIVTADGESFTYDENHTLTATYDQGDIRLYIDGAEVATGSTSGAVDLGEYSLAIGEDLDGWVGEQFLGVLDDVLIYGRALSATEVATMHDNGVTALDLGSEEPLEGDLNDDGFVGGDDLDIVRSFWGQTVETGNLQQGDPSEDGFVGGDDLDIVRANWGQGTPPAPNAIPEPSGALLVLSAIVGLLALRRRNEA